MLIKWVSVNDRWLPVDTGTSQLAGTGQVLSSMQAQAEKRRIAGTTNAFPTVRNAVAGLWRNRDGSKAELGTDGNPVWQIDEEWQGYETQPKLAPLRGTDYEYRNGAWFRVSDGKRVYTWNERNEATALYRTGTSASIVGEKFGAPAATIRTWARRQRMHDDNVWFRPRFDAP
jgi:hypothetical protein